MALFPAHLFPGLFFGGHSNTPLPLAAAFVALAIGMRVLRARGRSRRPGPWHGGPPGAGTGSDPPMQWDIRKAPEPEAAQDAAPEATQDAAPDATPEVSSEEQTPPSDL